MTVLLLDSKTHMTPASQGPGSIRQCIRLPRGWRGSPSLEVFQNHGDVALGVVVSGHSRVGLGLEIWEVFSNLNDPMVQQGTGTAGHLGLWLLLHQLGGTSLQPECDVSATSSCCVREGRGWLAEDQHFVVPK